MSMLYFPAAIYHNDKYKPIPTVMELFVYVQSTHYTYYHIIYNVCHGYFCFEKSPMSPQQYSEIEPRKTKFRKSEVDISEPL